MGNWKIVIYGGLEIATYAHLFQRQATYTPYILVSNGRENSLDDINNVQ